MTDEQRRLFDRVRRALKTAHTNLSDGDPPAAINRAYYAAYYAATAALLHAGETPGTHKGTHRRFHLHFVASGQFPVIIGQTLGFAYEMRRRADYETFTVFDEAAVADLITDVERFVQAVEAMLQA